MSLHPSRPTSMGLRLYGRRVVLRPLVPQDFAAWSEVRRRNGTWLTRWEPARPVIHPDPEGDRDLFAARCVARDRERQTGTQYSFGFFVDGAFAGGCGLTYGEFGISAEIGYWIRDRHEGRGLVTRAVERLMDEAFEVGGVHRVFIRAGVDNARSRAIPERLGFTREGVLRGDGRGTHGYYDLVMYSMLEDEWRARRTEE